MSRYRPARILILSTLSIGAVLGSMFLPLSWESAGALLAVGVLVGALALDYLWLG